MAIISIIFLIISLWISKIIFRTYISPITLFISVNFVSIILMYATSIVDHNISSIIWIYTVIMMASYIIGMMAGRYRLSVVSKRVIRNCTISDKNKLKKIIIIYSIIFNISVIYYLIHLNINYGIREMFMNMSGLNAAMQTGDFSIGIYTYFTPIGVSLSLMILYYTKNCIRRKKIKFLLYIQYVLCFIPAISPRRDTLFFMIAITLLYFLTQNERSIQFSKRIKMSFLVIVILVSGVWLMSYTQGIMNKSMANTVDFTLFGFDTPDFMKDPVVYVAGNYTYLQRLYDAGDLSFSTPLVSTLRLFYRYIGPYIGLNIDTTKYFALGFYNIGSSINLQFNTAPMLYYIIKESGVAFSLIFFVVGFLSRKAYSAVNQKRAIGSIMLGLFQYSIIAFSFRSYNLIYLFHLLTLLYMFIVYLYVDVNKNMEEII